MTEEDLTTDEEAEIIIGTYEDYVVGYRVEQIETSKKKPVDGDKNGISPSSAIKKAKSTSYSLEQSFAVRGHSGSIKCLAANSDGTLAFSAGIDEMINLFSLKRRKLIETTEGAYNCAAFVGKSHLICGSEDSNIYIYECKGSSMTIVKTLKGHKLPLTSLSVHPSGKVLLSLAKDNTMRTWNLIKGRSTYVTNIKSQAHLVCWSRTGEQEFLIAANNEIYLYNNSGILEHNLKLTKRINSIEFIDNNTFIVAIDSGVLEFFDFKTGTSILKHEAHESRIKSVMLLDDKLNKTTGAVRFVTASSDGVVKLWSFNVNSKLADVKAPQELASVDTGARLTCMTTTTTKSN